MELLPTEIWEEIADHCDGESARKLAQTCRKMAKSEHVRKAGEKRLKKEIDDYMCQRKKFADGLVWFVQRFPGAFDYKFYLATRIDHDVEVIRHFRAAWPWRYISSLSRYDNAVLEVYQDDLTAENWREISRDNFYLYDDEYLERWQEKLNWNCISEFLWLSVKTIARFQHRINWTLLSRSVHLNTKHMDAFADKLDWGAISLRNDIGWLRPKWYGKIDMNVCPLWIVFEQRKREQKERWLERVKFAGLVTIVWMSVDLIRRAIN